jgi:hypothetical protein
MPAACRSSAARPIDDPMNLHVPTLFAILGPVFLALGLLSLVQARALTGQARTWLLLGIIFSAVAVWLHVQAGAASPQ